MRPELVMQKLKEWKSGLFKRKEYYVLTPVGKVPFEHYKARYLKCTRVETLNGRPYKYNEFLELIEVLPPADKKKKRK